MTHKSMQPVVCADCGWRSRRLTGQIVICPRCGSVASYDVQDRSGQIPAKSSGQKEG